MQRSKITDIHEYFPFPKRQVIDSSKLKEFADNNLKLDENGRKLSKQIENTAGERRNCSLRAISPIPTVFSKDLYCRHVKTRAYLDKVKTQHNTTY